MTTESHVARTTKAKPDRCRDCGQPPVVSEVHHPRAATHHLGGRAWMHADLAPMVRDLWADLNERADQAPVIARHPENPRRGDHEAIVKSILNNGVYSPIKVQRSSGYIVAGNHTFDAMLDAGASQAPWVWLDVDDREARRIMADDNRTAELGGYDQAMLLENLRALDAAGDLDLTAWNADDLAELERATRAALGPRDGLTDPDDAPEVPEAPLSRTGEVWRLGPHRLIVGDATDPVVHGTLLGDERAVCVWTDPPYGVEYVGKTKDALTIQNDGAAGLEALLAATFDNLLAHTTPGAAWYVACPAGRLHYTFAEALVARDVLRQGLVWAKDHFVLGRSDYHYIHEPVLYGRTPSGGNGRFGRINGDGWYGPNNETTVWTIPRPKRSTEHPTMKPVELVARALRNSTRPGDLVLDPFAGSGTTLIACHREDREARLIEVDPRYADVICRRYQQYTGTLPVRDGVQVDFLT